ncbi:unnamed protein product [Bathycoccus prasinos]
MSAPLASTLLLYLPLSSATIQTIKKTRRRKGRRCFRSSLSSSSSIPQNGVGGAARVKNNGQISSPSSSHTTEEKDQKFFLRQQRRKEEELNKEERKVIILWDLDNVNPGTTCERFAINAKRIKKAGEKFGRVVAFRAFAGMQTSRDLSECCNNSDDSDDNEVDTKNNDENEDDTSTKVIKGFKRTFERLNLKTEFYLDGPDAADLRLGRRLMEFANESQGKKIQDVPAFITRRAEEACFLTSDDVKDDINEDNSYEDDEYDTTFSCDPELKHVSFCEQTRREYRNLAMAKQELLKLEGEKIHAACLEEKCSPDETKLRQIVKNRKHVAIVVTNDRDLKLPLDYAISMDVCVVLIGNFVDNSSKKMRSLVSSSSRKKKTSFRRLGGGGGEKRRKDSLNQISWSAYLDTVRLAAQKRPIARLKLLENADAALIWDSARRFTVSEDERDVLANAKSNSKEYEVSCPGDVVGMWRRHKSGVGAWFSSFDEDR